MLVWEVARLRGVSFTEVEQCFLADYSTEDAQRFWDSKWSEVQNTWMFYTPIYNLFWGRRNGNVA